MVSLGSSCNPVKIGYAGLLMSTKGAHVLIEPGQLQAMGIYFQANIAGSSFNPIISLFLRN